MLESTTNSFDYRYFKYSILRIVILVFSFFLIPIRTQAQQPGNFFTINEDYLLIVNAYTSDAPWSNAILDPIRHWAASDNRAIFIEHLNMLMIDNLAEFREIEADILKKYASRPPKAILLLGNSSMLLRDSIRSHWGDVSIVVCAEEKYIGPDIDYIDKRPILEKEQIPLYELANSYNLTVIQSKMFVQDNISLMRRMIPDMEEVILIGDGRYINQQLDYELSILLKSSYPAMKYEFFSAMDMTKEELLHRLGKIDPAVTGVLFSSWFSKSNYAGSTLLVTNSFQDVANVSVPVFALHRAAMENSGMVGGYFYDEQIFRLWLQQTIEKVLAGMPARDIPFHIPSDAIPTFNYPVLLLKGFTIDECPPGSVFLERPRSFWERNRYLVIFGGALAALSLLFLFLYQRYRIHVLKVLNEERKQKFETNKELAKLFDDMPIGYSKGKLERNNKKEIIDVEIVRMNGRFIHSFIGHENRLEGLKLSDLFGGDFQVFLHFLHLMDSQHRTITYSQYFSAEKEYVGIFITHATQPEHIDVYYINTTDLHTTQQKLDETNHKLAMALDVASIVPWNWDLKNQTITCDINHPVKSGNEDLASGEGNRLVIPDSQYFRKIHKEDRARVEKAFLNLVRGHVDKVREEYRIINHTERGYRLDWVEACATVGERDEKGRAQMLVGSLLIITQRKEMEMDLIDARDKAEESNRLKSAFLANMSHEIRTPLNAIVGFSGMLGTVEETEEREEYVRIIESNNDLLLQLIGDILDLSKIEAGTLEFVEAPHEITTLVKDMVCSLQKRADKKNLVITFEEYLPECLALIDNNRLNQVLTNLIVNAIKFTSEGRIKVGYTLQNDNMLHFYVTDTGCGIPLEKQQEVFTRFVKLNNFEQGTGLGLPITQMVINKLGGEIGLDSEPGRGSTFWFTIPYRKVKPALNSLPERSLMPVRSDRITILIAEDDASNYKLFETILKRDYRIVHAWNGKEAVELFGEQHPHIVLMDINMPVMDGYEATEEIRKISEEVPILAVTAYAYASDENRILSYGFDGYTSKPINVGDLRLKINELIKNRLLMMF